MALEVRQIDFDQFELLSGIFEQHLNIPKNIFRNSYYKFKSDENYEILID